MFSSMVDRLMGSQRLSYRRILAWAVATAFVPFGWISGEDYTAIVLVYVGSDSAAKSARAWRGGAA